MAQRVSVELECKTVQSMPLRLGIMQAGETQEVEVPILPQKADRRIPYKLTVSFADIKGTQLEITYSGFFAEVAKTPQEAQQPIKVSIGNFIIGPQEGAQMVKTPLSTATQEKPGTEGPQEGAQVVRSHQISSQ